MIRRGRGLATMFYPIAPNGLSACFIKLDSDGSAVLYTGTTDVGQGSLTVLSQLAAESLGIPIVQISVISADSKAAPYDQGPVGSRTTYVTGNAVLAACQQARGMLLEAAGRLLNVAPEALVAEQGYIYVSSFQQARITIAEAAAYSYTKLGKPILGSGYFNPHILPIDKLSGQGKQYATHAYATQIAIVDVDDETGEFELQRIYAVHDCGKAINPLLVEGQIQGGVSMGVGFACHEEMVLKEGKVINDQFTDYILPTAMDVPQIITDIIERPEPTGPFGAKGVGEPAILPTAPAIANALYDAVGVWIMDLPITAEKVCLALKEKRSSC